MGRSQVGGSPALKTRIRSSSSGYHRDKVSLFAGCRAEAASEGRTTDRSVRRAATLDVVRRPGGGLAQRPMEAQKELDLAALADCSASRYLRKGEYAPPRSFAIRKRRLDLGLLQKDLASAIGCDKDCLSRTFGPDLLGR